MKTQLLATGMMAAALSILAGPLAVADDKHDDRQKGASKIDPKSWVYGPRNNDTTGGVI